MVFSVATRTWVTERWRRKRVGRNGQQVSPEPGVLVTLVRHDLGSEEIRNTVSCVGSRAEGDNTERREE